MQRGRDRLLGVLHNIFENTNLRNVIIEGAPHENGSKGADNK